MRPKDPTARSRRLTVEDEQRAFRIGNDVLDQALITQTVNRHD
jgi:hypothetical protein